MDPAGYISMYVGGRETIKIKEQEAISLRGSWGDTGGVGRGKKDMKFSNNNKKRLLNF